MRPTAVEVTVQRDGVRTPVATARLEALAHQALRALGVRRGVVSVTLLPATAMARLNRQHLGHRGPTDVITFALGTDPIRGIMGDVYLCPEVARSQARTFGVGVREEMARLVVHGMLHVCGWDHPEGDDRMASPMWRRQEQLLRRFWLSPTGRG